VVTRRQLGGRGRRGEVRDAIGAGARRGPTGPGDMFGSPPLGKLSAKTPAPHGTRGKTNMRACVRPAMTRCACVWCGYCSYRGGGTAVLGMAWPPFVGNIGTSPPRVLGMGDDGWGRRAPGSWKKRAGGGERRTSTTLTATPTHPVCLSVCLSCWTDGFRKDAMPMPSEPLRVGGSSLTLGATPGATRRHQSPTGAPSPGNPPSGTAAGAAAAGGAGGAPRFAAAGGWAGQAQSDGIQHVCVCRFAR